MPRLLARCYNFDHNDCREQAAALYLPAFLISVMEVVDIMADKHAAARPGSFNDADMIVVVSNAAGFLLK
jgi:hypothetical protein